MTETLNYHTIREWLSKISGEPAMAITTERHLKKIEGKLADLAAELKAKNSEIAILERDITKKVQGELNAQDRIAELERLSKGMAKAYKAICDESDRKMLYEEIAGFKKRNY